MDCFVANAPRNDGDGACVNFRRLGRRTADSVERLMATRAEARFAFISDKAEFASEERLDVRSGTAVVPQRIWGGFRPVLAHLGPKTRDFKDFCAMSFPVDCVPPATAF